MLEHCEVREQITAILSYKSFENFFNFVPVQILTLSEGPVSSNHPDSLALHFLIDRPIEL